MFGFRNLRWLLVVLAAIAADRAYGLEIRETLWGFDGHVVPGHFSPLSLLVANSSDKPFDGEIACAETTTGFGGQRGAEYFQPAHLNPHATRWIQFQIFISNSQGEFEVSWGRGAGARQDVKDRIDPGPPACVWLIDESNGNPRTGDLKAFPAALFPTSVAATDSLDAVIIDRAPHWDAERSGAFLDWVKRGGTVHLAQGANGQFPAFSGSLEALNMAGERMRIGSGLAVRHPIPAREMSAHYLAEHGFPARVLKQEQNTTYYDLQTMLFQRLSSLTRPDIAWWAISLLAIVYIALIGPLPYLWRRKMEYRASIFAFLGVAGVFAGVFGALGRRGYHESQVVHSLSVARDLGGGRWDVTQWINAFAMKGDLYALEHTAPVNLYAAPSVGETVRGRIFNGKDGHFFADIPLFSSVQFVHQAVMQGDDTSVAVESWENTNGHLSKLRIRPGAYFPRGLIEVRVRSGNAFYEMVRHGDVFEMSSGAGADIVSEESLRRAAYDRNTGEGGGKETSEITSALPLLYARTLGRTGSYGQTVTERPMAEDRVQLFVAAQIPAGFLLRGKGFDHEDGYVLYVQDLFRPSEK